MKKRVLSFILVLCMLCTVLPVGAFANNTIDSGMCGDAAKWKLTADGVITISGTGPMWDFEITGFEGNEWGDERTVSTTPWDEYLWGGIQEVVIKSGITHVGECSFCGYLSMASGLGRSLPIISKITLADTVESIGAYAFARHSTKQIVIPMSVKMIGEGAIEPEWNDWFKIETDIFYDGTETEWDRITGSDEVKLDSQITIYYGGNDYIAYKFLNSSSGKYAGFDGSGYNISGDYYNAYLKAYKHHPIKFASANSILKSNWGGSCFGMSAFYMIYNYDFTDLSNYQKGAKKLADLDFPKNNPEIESLITYYHLMQRFDRSTHINNIHLDYVDRCRKTVKELNSGTDYLVLDISGSHAVVACGISETKDYFRIKIWDPNSFEYDYIDISKDYSETSFESGKYPDSKIVGFWSADMIPIYEEVIADDSNVKNSTLRTQRVYNLAQSGTDEKTYVQLITNYGNFSIEQGEESAVFENGKKISGDLIISNGILDSEDGYKERYIFFLDSQPTDDNPYVVTYSDTDSWEQVTSVMYDADADGYYTDVTTYSNGSVSFSSLGNTKVSFDDPRSFEITHVTDKGSEEWSTVKISGEAGEASVATDENGTNIKAENNEHIWIYTSDGVNDVDLGYYDSNSANYSINKIGNAFELIDCTNNAVVEEKNVTYNVLFNSLGGTLINPEKSVEYGETIYEPNIPVRYGYTFDGWYTDKNYDESSKWDFDNPVSQNIELYAKWTEDVENPFVDVKDNAWYRDAVLWAYYHTPEPVTKGTDATHFSPDDVCSRGQVVTFLWRLAGSPEPSGAVNPFVDVINSGECGYYYKAILWAYENGVTKGVDETHFAPLAAMTRGQLVTFLWRASGSPDTSAYKNSFADVTNSGVCQYYYDGILWAAANGITTGTGGNLFEPNLTVTRCQVVTFLSRYEA